MMTDMGEGQELMRDEKVSKGEARTLGTSLSVCRGIVVDHAEDDDEEFGGQAQDRQSSVTNSSEAPQDIDKGTVCALSYIVETSQVLKV